MVSLSDHVIRNAYVSASATSLDIGFGEDIIGALLAVKTGAASVLTIPAFTAGDKYFRLDLTTDDNNNLSDVIKMISLTTAKFHECDNTDLYVLGYGLDTHLF